MSVIGLRLKYLREKNDFSQKRVAESLGISNVQLSRYESGDRKPDPETLAQLADFYDVSIDYIIGRTNNTKNNNEFNPLNEINKILDEQGIENMFFYDMEAWKNFTPEDVEELRKHFEWVAHKAKERNKKER